MLLHAPFFGQSRRAVQLPYPALLCALTMWARLLELLPALASSVQNACHRASSARPARPSRSQCAGARKRGAGRAAPRNNSVLLKEPLQEGIASLWKVMGQQHRDAAQCSSQDICHFNFRSTGAVQVVETADKVWLACSWIVCFLAGDLGFIEFLAVVVGATGETQDVCFFKAVLQQLHMGKDVTAAQRGKNLERAAAQADSIVIVVHNRPISWRCLLWWRFPCAQGPCQLQIRHLGKQCSPHLLLHRQLHDRQSCIGRVASGVQDRLPMLQAHFVGVGAAFMQWSRALLSGP